MDIRSHADTEGEIILVTERRKKKEREKKSLFFQNGQFLSFIVHFSSLQTWCAGVVESRNLKLIEQEGIFMSTHHDKLTDL